MLCWSCTAFLPLQTCFCMKRSWHICASLAPVVLLCILCWIEGTGSMPASACGEKQELITCDFLLTLRHGTKQERSKSMKERQEGSIVVGVTSSPYAEDSPSVAAKMHNTFVENIVSTENPSEGCFNGQAYIRIATMHSNRLQQTLYLGGRRIRCRIVTILDTWGGDAGRVNSIHYIS